MGGRVTGCSDNPGTVCLAQVWVLLTLQWGQPVTLHKKHWLRVMREMEGALGVVGRGAEGTCPGSQEVARDPSGNAWMLNPKLPSRVFPE